LSDGRLTGATGQTGTFSFTARVEDAGSATDTVTLTLTVVNPLVPPERLTAYRIDTNHVQLRWRRVTYATSYYVYRASQADLSDAQLIAVTLDTKVSDTVTLPGDPNVIEHWFYYVVAVRNWP
jgi:hypothetical protein